MFWKKVSKDRFVKHGGVATAAPLFFSKEVILLVFKSADEMQLYQEGINNLGRAFDYLTRGRQQIILSSSNEAEKTKEERAMIEDFEAKVLSLEEEITNLELALTRVNMSSKDGWTWYCSCEAERR